MCVEIDIDQRMQSREYHDGVAQRTHRKRRVVTDIQLAGIALLGGFGLILHEGKIREDPSRSRDKIPADDSQTRAAR